MVPTRYPRLTKSYFRERQASVAVKIAIRPIDLGDIEAVANLLADLSTEFIIGEFERAAQQHFLRKNDAESIRGFLANGYRYHVAEVDGQLIGFVGVRDNSHLYHLFVAKALQRRGVGRMLWERAKHECELSGHRGPFTVNSSNNAVPIYERWGFRLAGPRVNSNGILYNPMRLDSDG